MVFAAAALEEKGCAGRRSVGQKTKMDNGGAGCVIVWFLPFLGHQDDIETQVAGLRGAIHRLTHGIPDWKGRRTVGQIEPEGWGSRILAGGYASGLGEGGVFLDGRQDGTGGGTGGRFIRRRPEGVADILRQCCRRLPDEIDETVDELFGIHHGNGYGKNC